MKTNIICALILVLMSFSGCQNNNSWYSTVHIKNASSYNISDVLIKLNVSDLNEAISNLNPDSLVVKSDSILPFQVNDLDFDNTPDELVFVCDLKPNEKKEIKIGKIGKNDRIRTFAKKTQAELSVKKGGKWENRKYIDIFAYK